MRPQRLVHHREGVRASVSRSGNTASSTRSPGCSPQRRCSAAGITRYGLAGMATKPPGSRRAMTTPAAAVRVSRSPGCQPSALVMARSETRPEESIRPNPYSTSSGTAGTSGATATGRRRAVAGLPCSRPPGRARGGIRGAMSGAVMAASPRGGAGRSGGLQAAGQRVQAMSGLGEISPVCVSEGDLNPHAGDSSPEW